MCVTEQEGGRSPQHASLFKPLPEAGIGIPNQTPYGPSYCPFCVLLCQTRRNSEIPDTARGSRKKDFVMVERD